MNNVGNDKPLSEQDVWAGVIPNIVAIIMSVAVSLDRQRVGNRKIKLCASQLEHILTKFCAQLLHDMEKGCECTGGKENKNLTPIQKNQKKTTSGCKAEKLRDDPCACDVSQKTSGPINAKRNVKMEDKSTDVSCDCMEDAKDEMFSKGHKSNVDASTEVNDDCSCHGEEDKETNTPAENKDDCLCEDEVNPCKTPTEKQAPVVTKETNLAASNKQDCACEDEGKPSKREDPADTSMKLQKEVSFASKHTRIPIGEASSNSSEEKNQQPENMQIATEKILVVSAGPEGMDESVNIDGDDKDSHKTVLTVKTIDQDQMEEILSNCTCMVSKEIDRIDKEITAVDERLKRKKSGECNCSKKVPESVNFIPNFDLVTKRVQTDLSCISETTRCGCKIPKEVSHIEKLPVDETHNYYDKLLPERPMVPKLQVRVSSLLDLTSTEIIVKAGMDFPEGNFACSLVHNCIPITDGLQITLKPNYRLMSLINSITWNL